MNNYFSQDSLVSAIGSATNLIELTDDNGGVLMVSEYGGRPLGIFPKEGCSSILWINQKIKEMILTKNRAIGGDRYWISPEREYFYEDPENWKNWFCPSGLDPAHYEVLGSTEKTCTLSSSLYVTNMRHQQIFQGEITRQFSLLKEPISMGISYVGIEFVDDCVFYQPNLKINGWTLANVISGGVDHPGTVLIPTKANPKPLSYFRIIPKDRITVGTNYIAYNIDVNDIYKLAVRPEDIDFDRKAKIAYILKMPESEEYGCLIKLSDDIPKTQQECFDVARDHPDSEIGVIQSFNAESPEKPLLRYGEIELQLNMFKTIDNTSHGKAIHQLIAYIGKKEEILTVIEEYLGIVNPFLF